MQLRRIAIPLTLILVAEASYGSKDRDHHVHVPELHCESGPLSVRLPKSLSELRKLGRLQREGVDWTWKVGAVTVTERHLDYGGMALVINTFSDDPKRYSLRLVDVSDPRWDHISPFKIGGSIDEARKLLGAKRELDEQFLAAYSNGGSSVEFRSAAGQLTGVVYKCPAR